MTAETRMGSPDFDFGRIKALPLQQSKVGGAFSQMQNANPTKSSPISATTDLVRYRPSLTVTILALYILKTALLPGNRFP